LSPPDDRGNSRRVSEEEIQLVLKDVEKRKRLATALSRAMWEEEKEDMVRDRARGMKG